MESDLVDAEYRVTLITATDPQQTSGTICATSADSSLSSAINH